MDRDYEEFLLTLPKLEANWDRDAKAAPRQREPPPVPKARKPKPRKVLNKPVVKGKDTKEPLFEDVVFETPPMTPELQPAFVPVASAQKEDDGFWDFYNQGLPPV